jgi:polyphosphate kinase
MNTNKININNPDRLFFNRELSLIEFNRRVLAEAEDKTHPLLERLKFIAILSSNLDEFFMIRVAGLKNQKTAGVVELSFDGMTPQEQLDEIRKRLIPIYKRQEELLNYDILPALELEGIFIHRFETLNSEDIEFLRNYFAKCVLPVLTPLTLDPAHPFPRIINRSLNIAFVLTDSSKNIAEKRVAFLQLPSVLPRFVKLPKQDGDHFVLLEQVVKINAESLFPGLIIEATNTFRVTRDADIEIAEDEAEDLLTEIAEEIKKRKWGTAPVRLEVSSNMPDYLLNILIKSLDIEQNDVYIHNRPLHLPDFMFLTKLDKRHLKFIPFQTRILPELLSQDTSIFEVIAKKDLLVHLPYDSFTNSVLRFLTEAVQDPKVIAIKITLYRTGLDSPIVAQLKKAAENGKDVTAFVELKARFDEENNIIWAKELENVGVHVVYGVIGLKTHCKICMVVRKEEDKLVSYLHLSTGNYNHITSRLYTDIGYFTARNGFQSDAINLFNYLTGYSFYKDWKRMLVAPINLRQKTLRLIERETELHSKNNPGHIFIKMNSLAHQEVMQALYKASQKGVKIQLIIRGVCCLRPGIKGISENIEVRSILGRFLEHSRIFYFKNSGNEEYYLSSADWMTRNLHNRVEITFPIL